MIGSLSIFGGSICDGASCAPLYFAYFIYAYGFYLAGIVTLIVAARSYSQYRKKKQKLSTVITLVVVGLILLAAKPVTGLHTSYQAVRAEKQQLVYIDFPVYSYKTDGKLKQSYISTLHKSQAVANKYDPNAQTENSQYAYLAQRYVSDKYDITVRQFNASKYATGAETCLPLDPEFFESGLRYGETCTQVGTSNLGTPVYGTVFYDQDYDSSSTTVGSTRVTIEASSPNTDSKEAMLNIMKTLQPINKNQITFAGSN